MVAGFKINFLKLLISVILGRDFKFSTTNPFYCMIFQLCRNAGGPIWHIDVLQSLTWTMNISLIGDEAHDMAPLGGPRVEVHPLGENLSDIIEQAQGTDRAKLELTDTSPFKSVWALVGHQVHPDLRIH